MMGFAGQVFGYKSVRAAAEEQEEDADFSDLVGKKIAICEGTAFEDILRENIPGDIDILQFKTTTDAAEAVVTGKADAAAMDYPVAKLAVGNHKELALYENNLNTYENGWAFQKGDKRRDEFSAVLEKFDKDGTLQNLMDKWTSGDETKKTLPEQTWPGSKGEIVFTSSPDYEPVYYMGEGGQILGYDVELMLLAAKELDYHVKFVGLNFDGMLPALASGKTDILGGGLAITDERKKTMDFTVPEYIGATALIVKKDSDLASGTGVTGELEFSTPSELEGKTFAAVKGTIMEQLIPELIPGAEPMVFNTAADCVAALKAGKVDVMYSSEPNALLYASLNPELGMVEEKIAEDNIGFALAKGGKYKKIIDDYIKKYREDGTLDELKSIWMGSDESKKVIDKSNLSGENGTIRVFAANEQLTMSYLDDSGDVVGYEIDLLYRIAREAGYDLQITTADFDGLLSALQGGKCDVAAGCISITEERKEMVDFSEPDFEGGIVALVRKTSSASSENEGFFASVSESFKKTFVVEERWKLILSGLLITIVISLASAIIGILAGFGLCMIRRSNSRAASKLVAIFVRIIQGMPIVVILMILYYIIFGSSNISGVVIAIIGFSINFAAYSSEMMRSGIEAVDPGQREAALALGFTPAQSFFGVVFPQAATHFIPVLKGEFISMVKMTSVVGYIAVEDLTKISDIIRARTMDAFFPLISTAIMYFVLANLLILIISIFENKIDIKKRPRKVKFNKSTFLVFFMLLSSLLLGLSSEWTVLAASEPEYTDFKELGGKKVGMITGAPFEELVKSKAPDVSEIQYFASMPDMLMALKAGKIDAYFMNNAVADLSVNQDSGIAVFPESLGDAAFGFAFAKGDGTRDKWQEAYDRIDEETKGKLWTKWTGADESAKVLPEQDWPGANGTVKVAACDTLQPMSYAGEDGQLIGFDIEMILLVAKNLDVHVEFTGMEFSAVMTEVQSGKALLGTGSIVVTDDRKEVVDFVEYYPASYVLIVRAKGTETEGNPGFFAGLSDSFRRTFITDNRYKMIFSGLGMTVLMAVASGVFGLVLAFCLVFLRQKNNKIINGIIAIYGSLIAGIPVVVILMVLYYIVFGAFQVSAIVIAIIGFALIYGSRAYGVIWNAVGAVDKGQTEAALALGYSESLAFREIILPQARGIYLPVLQSQFVLLLKETSVAGYITVLDLTRAGDLIRSRTMEAFFPLLAIAAIYFVLTWLLTKMVGQIDLQFEKKRNARRIKGVD